MHGINSRYFKTLKETETIDISVVKITTEMLRKYLVEYQSINNCGKVTIDNIHRSLIELKINIFE